MMWFFRHFWIFISYHIFLLNQVEGAIAIPPSNSAPLPLFCPSVCPSICPSIGLLITFSGFCTFADKSLGRNGIELEMQMFPDDLPLANIDADGYCCHFMRSSVRPTVHGLGFVYCIQSAWKKWPTIWHADVSRWLTLSIHGCLWILLLVCLSVHLSVCSFTAFSGGCVIIYVRQDLHDVCETTIFNLPSGIEAAQLDINSTLTIVVYRSPAVPIPQLNNVLNKIYHSQHCQHRVICGDFNIDIKDNPNAAHPSLPSMDQIIEEPTYFAGGTYTSLLDHIYIQNCTIFMSGVLDTYYSDHDAIFADIALHGYQQWVPQLTRSGL